MKRLVNFEPAPWTYRTEDTWADDIFAKLINQVLKHQHFGRNTQSVTLKTNYMQKLKLKSKRPERMILF